MSYYPQQDSNIRYKVKVVPDQSKTTKYKLDSATGVDTPDLAVKKDFTCFKAEVGKLDINKLVNIPTNLNNLKGKEDNLDAAKLKIVLVDLNKLSDVGDKEVVKNTKFNTLKKKVNYLKKIS